MLFRKTLGIFCLTEDPDNHLMWVHYAAQHKGYVLGFDTTDNLFSENGIVPRKVIYSPHPPLGDPTIEFARVKSAAWTYEQEWRCIREFDPKESRDVFFEASAVSEVILGSRMEDYDVSRIFQAIELMGLENPPTVSESKADRHTWKITHSTSAKCLCSECGGAGYVRNPLAAAQS